MKFDERFRERFWSKVDKRTDAECWAFTGARKNSGYGHFGVGSRTDGSRRVAVAHRIAYELERGPIPAGLFVMHLCDNPPCCNPAHLRLGTHSDNMADMASKGRHVACPGEKHGRAKLDEGDVQEIRALYANRALSQRAIAKQFGVSKRNVFAIVHGLIWRQP